MKTIQYIAILFFIFFDNLYSITITPKTTIASNCTYRGLTLTQNKPCLNTKIFVSQSGLYAGTSITTISYEANSTLPNVIKNANMQVNFFIGFDYVLGFSKIGVGYLDRQYIHDITLLNNISHSYFAYISIYKNSTIRAYYDIKNITDPLVLEYSIHSKSGYYNMYLTYGLHLKSNFQYIESEGELSLANIRLKGSVFAKYVMSLDDKTSIQKNAFMFGYRF